MTPDSPGSAIGKSELIVLMKQSLEAAGVRVEISGTIQGVSKARHSFDLIATKDARVVPIDLRFAQTGEVQLGDLLETYAKSLDAKATPAVLVAMPCATPDVRKSAATFGMVL